MNTIDDVLSLAAEHKWVPALAIVIGAAVRILKSGRFIPAVPPAWRPWLALVLGAALAVVQAVAGGLPWHRAIAGSLMAALTAIAGHDLVVESLRGGREFFSPRARLTIAAGTKVDPQ
jgi:hypothetical protein